MGPQAQLLLGSDRATGVAFTRADSPRVYADVRPRLARAVNAVRGLCAGSVDGHGYVDGHAHGYADGRTSAASPWRRSESQEGQLARSARPQHLPLWGQSGTRFGAGIDHFARNGATVPGSTYIGTASCPF